MRIAIPQLNYHTGNIRKNKEIMLEAIKKAQAEKAELIIFPELSVCGSFPRDLLEKEPFIEECRLAVEQLAMACGDMAAIIGAPNLDTQNGIMYNSAYFIQNGEVVDGVHKTILSDYDLFEESRYFVAGEDNTSIRYKNQNIRVLFDEYESDFIEKNDSFVIFIGTSPFSTEAQKNRMAVFSEISSRYSKNTIYAGRCGSSGSVLFDGNSMAFNFKGKLVHRLNEFEEELQVVDVRQLGSVPPLNVRATDRIEQIHRALVSGLRDYFYKHGFTKAVLGLSGGIDSALVAALAAEAIGKDNVLGILMPSEFSTSHSVTDAEDLAKNIGMPHQTISIRDIFDQFLQQLKPLFGDAPFNVAEENIQARIRGILVMAASNKFGHILLNTSNKSETAVGYGTLYGDLCGSLAVIGDVYKTDVYRLARYINRNGIVIPENTITKAPSAELRPDQKDQDSLPEYDVLDAILKLYIEENLSSERIIESGYPADIVEKTIGMVDRNEYKRAQCAPNLRISTKAFGIGRKMPF